MELSRDKSNSRLSATTEIEKRIFGELKTLFQVADNFPQGGPIRYSWDSKKNDGLRVLARLDRFYSFPEAAVSHADYRILGDSNHSDHLPV